MRAKLPPPPRIFFLYAASARVAESLLAVYNAKESPAPRLIDCRTLAQLCYPRTVGAALRRPECRTILLGLVAHQVAAFSMHLAPLINTTVLRLSASACFVRFVPTVTCALRVCNANGNHVMFDKTRRTRRLVALRLLIRHHAITKGNIVLFDPPRKCNNSVTIAVMTIVVRGCLIS